MKKIFLIVAVLMLATPALAVVPDVNVWAEQGDDVNKVEIWYEVDPPITDCDDGNRPRAFGLNIIVTDGNIIDINVPFEGECDDVNRGYGIFPGTITISGGVPGPWGEPVAPGDAPGAEGTGLDTNTIVVEMGSLYTGANCPDPCAMLFTFTVDMDCNVSIAGNAARTGTGSEGKGVVLENLAEVLVNFPEEPFKARGVSRFVPDVVGWEQSAAETEIVDVCELVVGDISWVCHSSIDYDHVVSTDPEADTEVKKGSSVDLLKSLGRPHVPDVVNEPNLAAQAAIEDVCGLSVGDVTAECNDTIAAGNVISTNPAYCNYPICGTAVDIVVSSGPCPACEVPNVIDMNQADACDAIVAAGYVLGAVTESNDCGVVGDFNVISSTPAAGATPECGSAVDIVICECYAGQPDYDEWEAAGKPICWCYPRQCHGDADGKKVGSTKTGYKYVESDDLAIMAAGWLIKDPPKGSGILGLEVNGVPVACADFAHNKVGSAKTGYKRIDSSDLALMATYWLVKEPPKDTGTPDDCTPGNRTPAP